MMLLSKREEIKEEEREHENYISEIGIRIKVPQNLSSFSC